MKTKASEALAKLRAKLEELNKQEKAGEIATGYKLKKWKQALKETRKIEGVTDSREAMAELVKHAKEYRKECQQFNRRPELTADKETRQRLAREGFQKLAAIMQGIDNKQKAGTISKAKAYTLKRGHLEAVDFDAYTLEAKEWGQLCQWMEELRAERQTKAKN